MRLVLERDTIWTPDACCHSLLVSIVATFSFSLAHRRVLFICRLPCPWLLDRSLTSSLNCRSLTLFFFPFRLGVTGLNSFIFNPFNITSCTLSLPIRHPTCPVVCAVLWV